MRSARRFFTSVALASYVLLAVGAAPLHFWQVGGCGESCHADFADTAASTHHIGSEVCDHAHHGSEEPDHPAPPREQHDSSKCFVCRILGQAQDKVVPPSLTTSDDVVATVSSVLPDFFPEPCSLGFLSRGPPAV